MSAPYLRARTGAADSFSAQSMSKARSQSLQEEVARALEHTAYEADVVIRR